MYFFLWLWKQTDLMPSKRVGSAGLLRSLPTWITLWFCNILPDTGKQNSYPEAGTKA